MDLIKGTYSTVNYIGEKVLQKVLTTLSKDASALEKMMETLSKLVEDSKKLGKKTQFKFLNCYNILQDIMMNHYPQIVFGAGSSTPILSPEQEIELDQVASDCSFYLRFAAGAYGDKMNYVLSGKKVWKALDPNDQDDEFIQLARIDKNQLVYRDWKAEAYNPAHCIVVLKEKREVLLVIRGSMEGGDFVTDLIATYISFSVIEDEKGRRSIRIDSSDPKVKESVGGLNDSMISSPDKKTNPKDKVLFTAKAHSGIFLAGIELYAKIRTKLEETFAKLPKDYRLAITGHSLGGGMTSVMTFLFLIHPLSYFNGKKLDDLIVGYSYGAPPTFDKVVAPILENHLFNVVNHYDLVPRLSFGSLKDLDKAIMSLNEKEPTDEILKKEIVRFNQDKRKYEMSAEEKKILKHYTDVFCELKENVLVNEKLYHLGRTFVQDKVENNDPKNKTITYTFKEVKGDEYLSDLIICIGMPIYHYPHLYKEGLTNNRKYTK